MSRMETSQLQIREITPEEAFITTGIHYDAVHGGPAREYYSQQILDDWSPRHAEGRAARIRGFIERGERYGLIAYLGDEAVGFALMDAAENWIQAIYVKGIFAGKGIGASLLNRLEEHAQALGIQSVWLQSSLNAVGFYRAHGYDQVKEELRPLPSGKRMRCVKMTKRLQAPTSE